MCSKEYSSCQQKKTSETGSSELGAESSDEALTRKIFQLALAIATEPSKLGQVRQMLVQLQEQRAIALDFSTWAPGHTAARVLSMPLESAHHAAVLVHPPSSKAGTSASLLQDS